MSNFRAYKATIVSGSTNLGKGTSYPNVWAIMKGENPASGSINLQGGGSINLVSIDNHQIFQCYPASITITAGAVIVLE